MPIFNFNIRTPSHISDTVQVVRDDHRAVRVELARYAGELLNDHAELLWVDQDWRIDVSDDAGLILYVVNISAMKSAATMAERD